MTEFRKHVLIMAWPAFGHIIPLLELSKKIAKYHQVTFAVSEFIVNEVLKRELISKDDFPLVGIADGFFPANFGNVTSLKSFNDMINSVMSGVEKLLRALPIVCSTDSSNGLGITAPVDVVIGDNILARSLAVCHDRHIPYYFFNTAAASITLVALLCDENYPTLPENEDDNLAFTEIPTPGAPLPLMANNMKILFRAIHQTIHLVSGIIVNSVLDIEEDVYQAIKKFPVMKDIPIRFVGPLLPASERLSATNFEQQENIRKWLNGKQDHSVVYVSFGSISVPVPEQIAEIARALLKLGKPFIWSLHPGHYQHLPEVITMKIGQQFEAQNSSFLMLSWAPQKLILLHSATVVFLSHCGWNSTLESVSGGVPVVAWPMFDDQKLNAEWLANRSMAIMIEGAGPKPKRLVSAEEIEEAILRVGWSGDSPKSIYREAAQIWKAIVITATEPGGNSETALHELIKFSD